MGYFLNKNFSIIECQEECLVHTVDSVQEGDKKKDVTLYLNKTAFFILAALLQNKKIDQIEDEIKKTFAFSEGKTTENLRAMIIDTTYRLEKIGVIISNEA